MKEKQFSYFATFNQDKKTTPHTKQEKESENVKTDVSFKFQYKYMYLLHFQAFLFLPPFFLQQWEQRQNWYPQLTHLSIFPTQPLIPSSGTLSSEPTLGP